MATICEDWSQRSYHNGQHAVRIFNVIECDTREQAQEAVGEYVKEFPPFHAELQFTPPSAFPVGPGRFQVYVAYACPMPAFTYMNLSRECSIADIDKFQNHLN